LKGDDRVKGLYLSGSPSTDEYSDIDLFVLSSVEDREGLERDRLKTASRVGKIMAEAMSTVPHTYVVVYEPGLKMDYCYHVLPEKPRPGTWSSTMNGRRGRYSGYERLYGFRMMVDGA